MRVIHARPSPLPVLFLFCLYFVSACTSFFILACLCPFFHYFFFKNEKFQQANSTVSRVCYKYCIPLQNFEQKDTSELFERKAEDITTYDCFPKA